MTLIIAGAVHTVGASMQGALRIYMNDITHDTTVVETTRAAWKMAMHAGNSLQLGVDMAFDIFILGGFILLGIAMIQHPQFGKWFGWPAIVIGAFGLGLNAWTFPTPPGSAGLFDGGPLVGMWFFAFTVQLYRIYKKNKTPDIATA